MDNSLTVIFRADASLEIGTGHVMRCLTLALGLLKKGASVSFLCREHDGNLIDLIRSHGFVVHALPLLPQGDYTEENPLDPAHAVWLGCNWQVDVEHCHAVLNDPVDWIIVDHYALDYRWEKAMRHKCHNMMCIDDLADRVHECDLLLDQNLGRTKGDYLELVSTDTQLLLGPKFALLRSEFAEWRDTSIASRKKPNLRHLLVAMGGVDSDNVTERVLKTVARCKLADLERITVVVGPTSPWFENIRIVASSLDIPTSILSGIDNMAELMTSCDFAIGAAGATTWERCNLGLPSVLIVLANNQQSIARHMSHAKAAFVIDEIEKLEVSLSTFLESPNLSQLMASYSQISSQILDAYGVNRVISALRSTHER